MNLPNKLTMLRIVLIPVFMGVLYWGFSGATYVALAIFIIASLTDLLDGKIARKYNLVTDFGKFADPLADKMLTTAALLWFVEAGQMPAWALLIVLIVILVISRRAARQRRRRRIYEQRRAEYMRRQRMEEQRRGNYTPRNSRSGYDRRRPR